MWALIMMMVLLRTGSVADTNCNKSSCSNLPNETCELNWLDFQHCQNVNLSNNNFVNINTSYKPTNYSNIKILDLSYNKLRKLPEDFLSNAIALEEIYLANNKLEELPKTFLNYSSKLKLLQLEGNLLTEVPSSVFHPELSLSVDCSCALASSIIQLQNINLAKPLRLSVICRSSSSSFKLDDFFAHSCGSRMLLVLYIVLPIVALGFITGAVVLYLWKKKNDSRDFENKPTSDKSPFNGQPRYMTRKMDDMTATENQGQRKDYENVFVGNPNTNIKPYEYLTDINRSGNQTMDEDFYLESDVNAGDQPIYTNTQGVYYNYHQPSHINTNKEEDDVYILPDH